MKVYFNGLAFTKSSFLKMMHREYAENVYWRRKGDVGIPNGQLKKTDFNGWLILSGATIIPKLYFDTNLGGLRRFATYQKCNLILH